MRQSENSQNNPQRKDAARSFNGSEQRQLSRSIGNPGAGEREPRDLQEDHKDPQQRNEPFDPPAECEDFLLKLKGIQVNHVNRNDVGVS